MNAKKDARDVQPSLNGRYGYTTSNQILQGPLNKNITVLAMTSGGTPPKTNMETQNCGLENVTPLKKRPCLVSMFNFEGSISNL